MNAHPATGINLDVFLAVMNICDADTLDMLARTSKTVHALTIQHGGLDIGTVLLAVLCRERSLLCDPTRVCRFERAIGVGQADGLVDEEGTYLAVRKAHIAKAVLRANSQAVLQADTESWGRRRASVPNPLLQHDHVGNMRWESEYPSH
jgi:hypothetical protein